MRRGLCLVGLILIAGCGQGEEVRSFGLTAGPAPTGHRLPALTVAAGAVDHPVTDGEVSSGEANVVADPSRPGAAVVSYIDFGGSIQVGVSRTTDGGATWKKTGVFANTQEGLHSADPSLAFGPDGTLYLGYLHGVDNGYTRGGGLYVVRSEDGGVTWGTPVLAVPSLDQGVCAGPDKPIVGTGPDGRVHISYQDHTDGPEDGCDGDGPTIVRIASSYDGGRSFAPPVTLSTFDDQAFGSMPRVLPDGTLLVSHLHFGTGALQQFVERSTDGGRTFTRILVADSMVVGATNAGAPLVANSIPVLSADPDGRVAMAWVAGEGLREDNQVEVRVSGDGGLTWKALPPVAAGLPIALQTWIAHGPDGRLHLFFYGATPGGLIDHYLTSFDGAAWTEPTRLNTAPSAGAVGHGFGFGHYPGLDVGPDGIAYPMWSDARDRPAALSFYLWTRSVRVGGSRPFSMPPTSEAPGGSGPTASPPPPPPPAPRVTVKRSRRGFDVRVDVGRDRRSVRLELRRGRRVVAKARLLLGIGARTARLRAGRGRYVLRVATIDAIGRRAVVTRRVAR